MPAGPPTLLIDTADLRTDLPGLQIVGDLNAFPTGERKGQDEDIPNRRGLLPVPGLVLGAFAFEIDVRIKGATTGQKIARLITISSALSGVASDGLIDLTFVLPNEDETDMDDWTARGRFVNGLQLAALNPRTGKTQLQFLNLDGLWRRTSDNFLFP